MAEPLLTRLLDAAATPIRGVPAGSVGSAKVVRKHWGEERWLVAEGAPFAFKIITIRAGQRTSLQFHEHKEEANLVLEGHAMLWFADRVEDDVVCRPLHPGHVVHIEPGRVHRIEAITDVTLVEVSTPQLDDVVRLADDRGRGDGRIDAEHA